MKLVVDNIIYSIQKWGGVSNYWSELRRGLLENDSIDVSELALVTKIISNNFKKDENFNTIKNSKLLLKTIERYQNPFPEINQAHLFHSSYYRYSKNPKSINITTAHDFSYELHFSGIKKYVHVTQKKKALYNSDVIICISNFTKDLMLNLYPKLSDKRIEVIYNGVNSKELLNNSKLSYPNLVSFENGEYALYIGDRKALYKNFRLACSSIEISKIPLIIVGGGTLTIEELSMLKNVKFQHVIFASDQELSYLYANALLLIYPSISEGFGIPLIEAQTLGCPIVSTNFSCIPEIANEGALLVDKLDKFTLSNSINEILKDTHTRNELIRLGYQNAKRFSWDETRKKTIELYRDIGNEN